MASTPPSPRRWIHAVYAPAVAVVLGVFLTDPGFHYPKANLDSCVYGTANRPFVYRALLPLMVRGATALVPASVREAFTAKVRPTIVGAWATRSGVDPRFATEHLIAVVLMYATLYGFVLVMRWLFRRLYACPPTLVDGVPLLGLLLLPMFFCWGSYLYDFPELFFYALGMALLLTRRWKAYLVVFALACVNKETAAFTAFFFAVHFRSQWRRWAYWALGAVQGVLVLGTKLSLEHLYRANPGDTMENHLWRNLGIVFHGPWAIGTVAGLCLLVLVVCVRWSENPRFVRDGIWLLVPVVGMTLVWGQVDEVRNYYGAFPALLLLIGHGFGRLVGLEASGAAEPGPELTLAAPSPLPTPASTPNA